MFSKFNLIREFRMKYFKDIEVLYEKFFFIIFKYCSISNNNVNTVITDMNLRSLIFLSLNRMLFLAIVGRFHIIHLYLDQTKKE